MHNFAPRKQTKVQMNESLSAWKCKSSLHLNECVCVCVCVCSYAQMFTFVCQSVTMTYHDDDDEHDERCGWLVGWLLFMFVRTFICVRVSVLVLVYSLPSKYSCTMLGIPLRNTLTCIKQINNKNDSGGDCDNNDNSNNHHNNPAHADSHTNRIIHTYPSTFHKAKHPTNIYDLTSLLCAGSIVCTVSQVLIYKRTFIPTYIHTYIHAL